MTIFRRKIKKRLSKLLELYRVGKGSEGIHIFIEIGSGNA